MYVLRNLYFAAPGRRDEVLATRKRASQVRVKIGLPYGRIYAVINPELDQPDVVWEQEFDSLGDIQRDMDARGASEEFGAVRNEMRPLLRKFVVLRLRQEA